MGSREPDLLASFHFTLFVVKSSPIEGWIVQVSERLRKFFVRATTIWTGWLENSIE